MASSSNSSGHKSFKYDVFLSFRGEDTRKNFVDHLYHALMDKGIYTYKDDEKIHKGKRIKDDLFESIEDSRFYIIVFSKTYASSSWCLEELVKIMECHKMTGHTAYPVFYDVEPTDVRKQSGDVGKAFAKHKKEVRKKRWAFGLAITMKKKKAMLKKCKRALKKAAYLLKKDGHKAKKWKGALKKAAGLAGSELKNTLDGHEAKFIKKIVHEISLELRSINFGFDKKLVGMETRVKNVVSSLKVGTDEVRMIGIKGMVGVGKTATARAVYDNISAYFEAKIFVGDVREVSNASMSGLKNLQEQVLSKVLSERVTLDSVDDGKDMMKKRMCGKKVLLVLDDVDHIEQLEALAGEPEWFKKGSRILITTRDEQVLIAHKVLLNHDINFLSDKEAICLFSRYAFGRENPLQGYEELSEKVVSYADGLPLTVKVLGSFLCGKDKEEWVDAINRLKVIPLEGTLKRLELSYMSLENEYKEIFLDIACILRGELKEDAIRILECCGFHARNGLKVLEQRSLITVDEYEFLRMHKHIVEMGMNIVRREHPDEPSEHSRLWIGEEIEDILANDMGTEATRCIKLIESRLNPRILMKGHGKMKKLRYLEVHFADGNIWQSDGECIGSDPNSDDTSQYFTNSLKYLRCVDYPFLYLPKTFQANNLVGLKMEYAYSMVQLWEEGEIKDLKKLKYLSITESKLTTFDFRITPNLEMLSLEGSFDLEELCMPVSCQKLKYLSISESKFRTFDLGLTPNLERLSLEFCSAFEELQVSVACPNLKVLNLRISGLRSLDLELIPNLVSLNLAFCDELVEINAPVGCLKKVVDLDLLGCSRFAFVCRGRSEPKVNSSSATLDSLEKFPEDLGRLEYFPDMLESLQTLDLSGTRIKHLPDSLCMSKHLESLIAKNMDLLEKLPEDLGRLECLEMIRVRSKKIEYLPDSICMLKRLKWLDVAHCCLGNLPENIGQLESLKGLVLSATKIAHLPDSICMLKHLNHLILHDCALLEKLPEDLGQLECLKELDITSTGISHLPQSIFGLKGLLIAASSELLQLYDFPSEIETTTSYWPWA